jgi:hypothetical protein
MKRSLIRGANVIIKASKALKPPTSPIRAPAGMMTALKDTTAGNPKAGCGALSKGEG